MMLLETNFMYNFTANMLIKKQLSLKAQCMCTAITFNTKKREHSLCLRVKTMWPYIYTVIITDTSKKIAFM